MSRTFAAGERVRVLGMPHMAGEATGAIALQVPGPVLEIRFGGMEKPHRWYVASEVEGEAKVGAAVKVKGEPHMGMEKMPRDGVVTAVEPGPAYAISFDGMAEMAPHRWYVASELASLKTDSVTRVLRLDLDPGPGTLESPQRMPDGSWRLEGYATRAGVFRYLNPDGSERLEFRPPDEVEKSAPGLAHRAFTNQHPGEGRVTPANADKFQRGLVLESRWDPGTKRVPVVCLATHQDLIDALRAGRRELSAGYEATVTEEAGEYEGQRYTHVQRDILYNHLAAVDAGRAGPECALRLDANGDALPVPPLPAGNPVTPPPVGGAKEKSMVKVTINGVEYEVSEAVAAALKAEREAMQAKFAEAEKAEASALEDVKDKEALVATAEAAKADVSAKLDAAEKSLKATQVKLDEAKDEARTLRRQRDDGSNEAVIQKRVMERTDLQLKVSDVLGKNYDYAAASNQKLRVDALEKVLEGREASKKRLAGYVAAKDDAAISALFDHVFEERADGVPALGGTHSPPANVPPADPFLAAQEKLKQSQRAKPS